MKYPGLTQCTEKSVKIFVRVMEVWRNPYGMPADADKNLFR